MFNFRTYANNIFIKDLGHLLCSFIQGQKTSLKQALSKQEELEMHGASLKTGIVYLLSGFICCRQYFFI